MISKAITHMLVIFLLLLQTLKVNQLKKRKVYLSIVTGPLLMANGQEDAEEAAHSSQGG